MVSFSHGWVDLLLTLVVVGALLVGLGIRGAEGATGAAGWTIVPSPNVGGVDSRLMDIVGVDDTEAWAVGLAGTQALVESWDGSAWSIATLPALSGQSALYGVDSAPSGEVWAVGRLGRHTLVLRRQGGGWQVVPSPNVAGAANRLLSVSARSRRDAWAVGKAGTGVVIEHWNGKAWSLVSHPPLRAPSVLSTVLAWPHGSVWAVGAEGRPSIGFDNALSMRWTGSRWIRRPVPLPKSPWPSARSRLEGLAMGMDGLWTVGWFTPDEASSGPEPIAYLWASGEWHSVWFKGRADTDYSIPYGLWGSPSHRVWAVGVSGPFTWSMRFSSEWDEVDTPNVLAPEDGNNVLRDVDGSGGVEWAVGYADARTSPDQTLIMRYQA